MVAAPAAWYRQQAQLCNRNISRHKILPSTRFPDQNLLYMNEVQQLPLILDDEAGLSTLLRDIKKNIPCG